MKRLLLIFFIFFSLIELSVAEDILMSKEYSKAYSEVLKLRFEAANKIMELQVETQPHNVAYCYLNSYVDFLKAFITEEDRYYNAFLDKYSGRESKLKMVSSKNPWRLYSLGQMNLQAAVISLKKDDYFHAAISLNKAYIQFNENHKKYPSFSPNNAGMALLNVLIGSIPDSYTWAVNLMGFEGNLQQGLTQFNKILSSGPKEPYPYLFDECLFLYTFITFNLAPQNENTETIIDLLSNELIETRVKENPLLIYTIASFYLHQGQNESALRLLKKRPTDRSYFNFPFLNYLTGVAYLNKLDNNARLYFLYYVSQFKGKSFVKSAYQRLAWSYLILGDSINYLNYISRVSYTGSVQIENDKEAQKEYDGKLLPNATLLKLRLLFDGGYYSQARSLAVSLIPEKLNESGRIELIYRKGRIEHRSGNIEKAKQFYLLTYNQGKNYPLYFAANALLNLGSIYEEEKDINKALWCYKECLSLNFSDYRLSIQQKAKAGINRLS